MQDMTCVLFFFFLQYAEKCFIVQIKVKIVNKETEIKQNSLLHPRHQLCLVNLLIKNE